MLYYTGSEPLSHRDSSTVEVFIKRAQRVERLTCRRAASLVRNSGFTDRATATSVVLPPPVSATCRRARHVASLAGESPPVETRGPARLAAWPDVKVARVSKPVPRGARRGPEGRRRRRLRPRLSPSTAPPSCRSTWSAGRPGRDTWCPRGSRPQSTDRPGIRSAAPVAPVTARRRVGTRSRASCVSTVGSSFIMN